MLKTGDIVQGIVKKVAATYIVVSILNNYKGLVHISEASDFYVDDITRMFQVGEKLFFKIIETNLNKKWIRLSFKAFIPRLQRDPFSFDFDAKKTGAKNLLAKVKRDLENARD